ncbi:hypothetical protein DPMN_029339 [Dreissena polymorpha]|uniref:Uncharacterized protein n=1 Tax=Dreissena polymorpha TaxID=45954 RepID=A0A9D4RFD8_DREPO|nr:hypothetical protein DPMN_029339 [Dreissena polymorpha]
MADSSLKKLTLQLPDGKRVSFHVDEETYRLAVDEKGEDTIRYLVSQTVDGEQDSDSSDVPATEDQSVDASSLDSRTADSGAASASGCMCL